METPNASKRLRPYPLESRNITTPLLSDNLTHLFSTENQVSGRPGEETKHILSALMLQQKSLPDDFFMYHTNIRTLELPNCRFPTIPPALYTLTDVSILLSVICC